MSEIKQHPTLFKPLLQESATGNYRPWLTEEFKGLIEEVKAKLHPLFKHEYAHGLVYFEAEDHDLMDYDCCTNCAEKVKKEIQEALSLTDKDIEEYCTDNSGDHEKIERCYSCGVYFNQSLTWVETELDYLEDSEVDLSDEDYVFTVLAVFGSLPSCDYAIEGYPKHQFSLGNGKPLADALKWREEFYERLVKLALQIKTTKLK